MKINYKDILKLVLSIAFTVWVFSYASKDIDWNETWEALKTFNYGWIFLSVILSIFSHALRAYRWTLLLETRNYRPGVFTTYLAVMIGYLANMAIPRLGEVARCGVLKKQSNIPLSFSLGTVITDRLIDLLMLGLLTLFLLLMQFDRLQSYFVEFINDKLPFLESSWPFILLLGAGGLTLLVYVIRKSRKEENTNSLLYKVGHFISELILGIKTVGKVTKPLQFWFSTLAIWVLYFLMLYVISFGYSPTDDLSLMAGVAILVMGSLGMAVPVTNGIGAYQAFVAGILVVYGITWEDGFNFAIISHGSQVVAVILFGFLSLLILNFRKKGKIVDTEQS